MFRLEKRSPPPTEVDDGQDGPRSYYCIPSDRSHWRPIASGARTRYLEPTSGYVR